MRNAGDRTPGGSAGRRHRSRAPEQPSAPAGAAGASLFTPAYRASHAPASRPPGYDPAGPGSHPAAPAGYGRADLPGPGYAWPDSELAPPGTGYSADSGSGWADDPLGAGYAWPAGDHAADAWPGSGALSRQTAVQPRGNAVRGFPPAPGEPLPVYPPGPFAA